MPAAAPALEVLDDFLFVDAFGGEYLLKVGRRLFNAARSVSERLRRAGR